MRQQCVRVVSGGEEENVPDAIDVNDPIVRKMRLVVYTHLREIGYFQPLMLAPEGHINVAKIACRDDRSFMKEAHWIEDLHHQKEREMAVMPFPVFGGAMRFSPFCPEMPDHVLGFKTSPNVYHCEALVEAIRCGYVFRGVHLVKAGGHGVFCGWASKLGLGLFQHTRLTIDGRNVIKDRSRRENWGDFGIFAAHHMDCRHDGEEKPRTYALNHDHPLVRKYPMELTMENLDDRRFLEIEAPHLLEEFALD